MNALHTADTSANFGQAESNAKEASIKLGNAKSAQTSAQAEYDFVKGQLKIFTDKQDAAQAAYDKDSSNVNKQLLDNAKAQVDYWNGQVNLYKDLLDNAKAETNKEQDQVNYWNKIVNDVKQSPRYAEFQAEIAKDTATVKLFNDAKTNMANAAKAASQVAPLQTAYDNSVKLLKAYQSELAQAQAKLAAMQGTATNPDQPANPSDKPSTGDNQGNKPSTGDNTNTPSDNNNGSATENNGTNSSVAKDFTGVKGNKYYVNGVEVTKKAYEDHVAAAAKVSANAAAKTNANNAAALPQTGNENSAAVVALGAVSAMFGLGLAAKKREL